MLLPSPSPVNNILGAMTLDKDFTLGDYKGILYFHENDFRENRASGQQEILDLIIKKIIAQSEGQLSNSDTGVLDTVCWPSDK